ncbi:MULTISPECIES: DUF6377 domain-containing protein [unclassified Dysgonomonas]|uniref:DUF6377 domain-containing protein n=1 Tax=unclassified Dysgonomonas TaxID=2630389 RepID=UPI001629B8DE|nr:MULTISPECIES: DUF6377 domain-containing protein [unclassified Dysgonomonas]
MIRYIIILILLFTALGNISSKNETDSIAKELNNALNNIESYDAVKEKNIQNLKQMLTIKNLYPEQIYEINSKLCNEYRKYISDSAVTYVLDNIKIANQIGNLDLKNEANLELAWLYSTEGLYIEAKNILDNIDRSTLIKEQLPDYYEIYNAFCSHYGQSNNNANYYKKSELYRDSLLMVLDTQSTLYQITYATKIFYKGQRDEAETILLSLLDKTSDKDADRAVIAYMLGLKYKEDGNIELQKKYLSMSAITDIKNSIKDNASLQGLALMYYGMGDIDLAYKFIEMAINDAVFCNVRCRTFETSSFYPLINAAYQAKENKQKSELQSYLILISILSVFLIIGIIYVYRQMKRLSRIRKELYHTNVKLSKLNEDLNSANSSLSEANHIKEEYIAHFFDLCSTYIDKFEDYRKSLSKLAANNKIEDLFKALKSTILIENELEDLYKNFDSIFLNIYPTFVEEFNALLLPDEQILPKQGEFLNTELRIFALIRLGITDSVKIASFLRYSLRTVYNYRTKVRNKAADSRDEFEERVKEIGAVSKKYK